VFAHVEDFHGVAEPLEKVPVDDDVRPQSAGMTVFTYLETNTLELLEAVSSFGSSRCIDSNERGWHCYELLITMREEEGEEWEGG
jgi:hypothetical protein